MEMSRITSAADWRGPDVDYRADMMHQLTAAEIAEIGTALAGCRNHDISGIGPGDFILPEFGPRLRQMRDDLLTGNGVLLLRGLQRAGFDDDDMARIYVGIGSHFGAPVAQSWQGELLGNIIDVSDVKDRIRGYQKGGAQTFHSDGTMCDVVALMCLRTAVSGGDSRIVSAVALHNALLERRPDLLEVLYKGYFYRYNEWDGQGIPDPIQTGHRIPVFAANDGELCCVQETGHIRNATSAGGIALSAVETEAYEELQRLARSPEFFLDMGFEPGDMQFLNNRVILHGRTDYEDRDEITERRHLLRLWLYVQAWPARPASQMFATPGVVNHWLNTRRPFMDLPGGFLEEAVQMQGERARTDTLLPRTKPNINSAEWAAAKAS